ncbi:alpha-amylase family glycosyl hydrolase [Deinococcus ficus]|uniref:alpha-amylase family glycosyl hydrolase n=1 Tax=Deinococcus ficus TaxID=317577 RepID=UPI00040F2B99|nr:alpha-amylase family glycosyl hydrolase [Deinococcus ficus]
MSGDRGTCLTSESIVRLPTQHSSESVHYFHTFYDFMPDVNVAHGPLREELLDILRFWLRQGVQGFRLDALPFLLKDRAQGEHLGAPHDFLKAMRRVVAEHVPDGVLLAEVNKPLAETVRYFGQGDEVNLMLNFSLCSHMFLALATGEARHIQDWWRALPPVPPAANWANFVRNHDELALAELTAEEQAQVYRRSDPGRNTGGPTAAFAVAWHRW